MIKKKYFFPAGKHSSFGWIRKCGLGEGGLYLTFRKPRNSPYLLNINGHGYVNGEEVQLNRGCKTTSSFENWARRRGEQIKR